MKLLNSKDHYSGITRPFGGLFFIANIALMGWRWEYGGSPSAISIAVIPRDQISVFLLYFDFEITSGDIQKGLPITVFVSAKVYSSSAETPKSANLT